MDGNKFKKIKYSFINSYSFHIFFFSLFFLVHFYTFTYVYQFLYLCIIQKHDKNNHVIINIFDDHVKIHEKKNKTVSNK